MSFSSWDRGAFASADSIGDNRRFERSNSVTAEDTKPLIGSISELGETEMEEDKRIHAVSANIQQVANNLRQMLRLGEMIEAGTTNLAHSTEYADARRLQERRIADLSSRLSTLLELTKELAIKVTSDLRALPTGGIGRPQKDRLLRLTGDHQMVMEQLQTVQLASMTRLQAAQKLRKEQDEKDALTKSHSSTTEPHVTLLFRPEQQQEQFDQNDSHHHEQQQTQQLTTTQSSQEQSQYIDPFQQSLLAERERGIREIQESMVQVAELFRDLGTLATEQTGLLDHIEAGLEGSAGRTRAAVRELTISRERRRRRSWSRAICSGLLVIVVGLLIIGIINSI